MKNREKLHRKFFNQIRSNYFCAAIIVLILIKQLLVSGIPIYVRDSGGADEYLMISQAQSLLSGHYLGTYNSLTLVKGIAFPVFLAIINWLGLSYLDGITILYSIACLSALYVMRKMIKNKLICILFFSLLLFCPATYSTNNTTLVYRDALTPALEIFLLSSLMLMYLYLLDNKARFILWSIAAAVSWSFLYNTREDTIWTIPLFAVVLSVMCWKIFINRKYILKRSLLCTLFFALFPCIFLVFVINGISYLNYLNYGIYTINELNDSNYTKAVMLLMRVKPDKEIPYVTITRDTLKKCYEVSPALKSLEDVIEADYNMPSALVKAGRNPDNGEINEDLITWELRGAASSKGYYENAQKAETYWGRVADEIQAAINDGKLKTRTILPSRSLIPYSTHENPMTEILKSMVTLTKYTLDYSKCLIKVDITDPGISESCIREYEAVTGNYAVRSPMVNVVISGWVFPENNNDKCNVTLEDKNGNTTNVSLVESSDLYQAFLKKDKKFENAQKARFSINETFNSAEGLKLVVKNSLGETVGIRELDKDDIGKWAEGFEHGFDQVSIKEINDPPLDYANVRTARLKTIESIYAAIGIPFAVIAIFYYFFSTIRLFMHYTLEKLKKWLFLSSILGSFLIVIVGLSYVNALMVDTYSYLTGAYALILLFVSASNSFLLQELAAFIQKRIVKKEGGTL